MSTNATIDDFKKDLPEKVVRQAEFTWKHFKRFCDGSEELMYWLQIANAYLAGRADVSEEVYRDSMNRLRKGEL